MTEIRMTKIDWVEFVTYKDYLRLKEEKEKLNIIIENTKKEQEADRKHIEELEEENKKLRKENKKLGNKLLKLCGRIYENIDKGKRKEYQEFCNRHKI